MLLLPVLVLAMPRMRAVSEPIVAVIVAYRTAIRQGG